MSTQSVSVSEEIQELLKLVSISQKQLAAELGVPYDTVRGWSSGRADPTPENREKLVAFVREHAGRLKEAAEELEGEGD